MLFSFFKRRYRCRMCHAEITVRFMKETTSVRVSSVTRVRTYSSSDNIRRLTHGVYSVLRNFGLSSDPKCQENAERARRNSRDLRTRISLLRVWREVDITGVQHKPSTDIIKIPFEFPRRVERKARDVARVSRRTGRENAHWRAGVTTLLCGGCK